MSECMSIPSTPSPHSSPLNPSIDIEERAIIARGYGGLWWIRTNWLAMHVSLENEMVLKTGKAKISALIGALANSYLWKLLGDF